MAERRFNSMEDYDSWRQEAERYIGQNWDTWSESQRKAAMNKYRELSAMAERDINASEKSRQEKKAEDSQNMGAAVGLGTAVASPFLYQGAQSYFNPKNPEIKPTVKPTSTTTTQVVDQVSNPPAQSNQVTQQGSNQMVDPSSTGAPSYAGEPQIIPQGGSVPDGYTAVGTDASGGTITVPNENIQSDGSVNLGAYAQGAAGAFQLYNAYDQYQEGDEVGAGLSAAAGAANLAAAGGNATAGSVAPYAGLAMGAYNTHNAAQDGSRTRDQKGSEVMKQVGLTAADYFTFGLSGLADTAFRSTGFGKKWGGKVDDLTSKTFGAKAIGSVLGGLDTKHTQLKNTQKLLKDAEKSGDQNYLKYIEGARIGTAEEPENNKKGVYFAGKYKNWDEYKKAGLEAADLTHTLGNIETFGPEWAALTEDQRKVVTQALIDQDLYISDKGEVNIRKENREKAKQTYEALKATGFSSTGDPMFGDPVNPSPTPEAAPSQDTPLFDPMAATKPLTTEAPQSNNSEFPQFEPSGLNQSGEQSAMNNNKMLVQPGASLPQSQPSYGTMSPQAVQDLFKTPEYQARYGDEGTRNKEYWKAHDEAVKFQQSMPEIPQYQPFQDPYQSMAMQGVGASPTAPAQPSFLTPEQWAQVQQYQATNAKKY